ncbi:MAG TPA: ATP-binding cassette domain-containing protein [Anaeromyxobacteraceae bacterium]|nr:ATP-binding cassette domain-containing protein [Anaeromyxobacteraceae bacterium]
MSSVRLERLSFAHSGSPPLLSDVSVHLPAGLTGVVGENGSGKTTLLRLVSGDLHPTAGRIRVEPAGARAVLCSQRVDGDPGPDVAALGYRADGEAHALRGILRLDRAALARWPTLSPGERKRWQVAAALASSPDVLLLDEPTNHADGEARAWIATALARFRGVGLLVSHDRALLDAVTRRTLRLHRGALTLHDQSYGAARVTWEAAAARAWEQRAEAQRQVRKAEDRLARAREVRDAAERSRSGRGRDPRDRDARSILASTKRMWAEDRLGRNVGRLRTAVEQARGEVPAPPPEPDLGRSVFLGFEPPRRPVLLSLEADVVGAGDRPVLRDVRVQLRRGERVRLEGPNGAGKTTLLSALLARSDLPPDRILFLPQELPSGEGPRLAAGIRAMEPAARGRVLSAYAALGCDPARLLASREPSPGETRKLRLALGLGTHAWALVLDEPTNHLDLPGVERIERALASYPGAILLVSHDDAFAARCTASSWRIDDGCVQV